MTITDFLLARIAEDEAALERTGPFPHSTHGRDLVGTYRADCPDCIGVPSRKRVLAECAAKRAIVSECRPGTLDDLDSGEDAQPAPMWVARALAAVYADHPDYRQEWAV